MHSHNDLGVTLPAAAAGRMRSPENRSAPGEHLHVMPIMRGHNGPRIDESPSGEPRGAFCFCASAGPFGSPGRSRAATPARRINDPANGVPGGANP